jgi:quinol monooxygenase YgiN
MTAELHSIAAGIGIGCATAAVSRWRDRVPRTLAHAEPWTTVAAVLTVRVSPELECRFMQHAIALTASVSALPGANAFAVHRSLEPDASGVGYVIYEVWQSRELFTAHWASDRLRSFHDSLDEFLVEEPTLHLYVGWFDWAKAAVGPNVAD